ncbi:hypothetical protein G6M50_10245 [Agrobacterium rhizogenes]|nr:hypothetical protein [Rhizobium rhizogenes]NTJ78165.1 hypothetical protein [Rhizobium rhizogenes]
MFKVSKVAALPKNGFFQYLLYGSLLASSAAAALMGSPARADLFAREGIQYFPRKVNVLSADYDGNYLPQVIKRDIFIFQPHVIVDTPLYSSGGDITIAADDLAINAPIDTRVRFQVQPYFWRPNSKGYEGNYDSPDGVNFDILFRSVASLERPFHDVYYWREAYDSTRKMYVFGVREPPPLDTDPFSDDHTGEKFVQLPSGLIPHADGATRGSYDQVNARNGEDAPGQSVVWSEVKSGTIRIFANRISLCAACIAAINVHKDVKYWGGLMDPYDPAPSGADGAVARASFFEAGGLKGGRGGFGSSYYCPHEIRPGNWCGNLDGRPGAHSGAPGKGGDAGDVELYLVNTQANEAAASLLKQATDVEGGYPAGLSDVITPSVAALRSDSTRNVFKPTGHPRDPGPLRGADGNFSVSYVNSDQAIENISEFLQTLLIQNKYDIGGLIQPARTNDGTFFLFPDKMLVPMFLQELSDLRRSLLAETPGALGKPSSSVVLPPLLSTLTCDSSKYVSLETLAGSVLDQICEMKADRGLDDVRSVLLHGGGLLEPASSDSAVLIQHAETIAQLEDTKELLRKILDRLDQIKGQIDQASFAQLKDRIEAKLNELDKVRKDIIAKAPKNPGFGDWQGHVQGMVDHFVKAYGAIVSETYPLAAKEFADGMKDADYVLETKVAVDGADASDVDNEIESLKVALRDLKDAFEQSVIDLSALRDANVAGLVEDRTKKIDRQVEGVVAFDQLYRGAIQDYLLAPAKQGERLAGNITQIGNTLDGELGQGKDFNAITVGDSCSQPVSYDSASGWLGCVMMERRSQDYAVILDSGAMTNIPLIVIGSGTGAVPVNFGNLAKKDQIKFLELGGSINRN